MSRTRRKGFQFVKELVNDTPRIRFGDQNKHFFNGPHTYKQTYHRKHRAIIRRKLHRLFQDQEANVHVHKHTSRSPYYDW